MILSIRYDSIGDFTSINEAIDAAKDGDEIRLCAEVYTITEPINTDGKEIWLRGLKDTTTGVPVSIICTEGSTRVFECNSGEGVNTKFENSKSTFLK